MGKVNVLDKHTAELIAAGEVVERPASVVKELVENAIDAGSSSVTVEIKNGGTTFIRVADNGDGIERDDVPVAFLRHATSKVKKESDLERIMTLGFRGEALASISAVAKVEVFTRTKEELAGTHYVIEGGEETAYEDTGCPVGTTIIVRDLFYNTPARMKFLKKDTSEANAVAAMLDRVALSHPEVAVRFIRDGKEDMATQGNSELKSCIYAVHGKQFADGLMPVKYTLNFITVNGFISQPHNARANRGMQHFFINGRYVKSRTMQVALEEACKGSIMVGKFPSCVLNLGISAEAVDVNVHPAKTEVRFENERPVFDAVYHAVKFALGKEEKKPEITLSQPAPQDAPQNTISKAPESISASTKVFTEPTIKEIMPPKPAYYAKNENALHDGTQYQYSISSVPVFSDREEELPKRNTFAEYPGEDDDRTVFAEASAEADIRQNVIQEMPDEPQYRIIGEAFSAYILVEMEQELLLIDKHAAHERMLYEQLQKGCDEAQMQFLLSPVTVRLEKNEYSAVLGNVETLQKAGFEIDDFGVGTVIIRAVPMMLAGTDIESAVVEIAEALVQNKQSIRTSYLDWIYHSVACRAAVKAGDISNIHEVEALMERLMDNPDIQHCPHGRPVAIKLTKREIEKKFGRV